MDYIPGELLIYRLKRCPDMEKTCLLSWTRQLLHQLEQYQLCKGGQNYRYVNPYSVLVTKEEKLLLLDLEAKSNEFVLLNMQKRAMRKHFMRPASSPLENGTISPDLYGYAKTIQFLLANTHASPSLTKREETRLEKIIDKCLCENSKKQYENFKQIQKDLPSPHGTHFTEGKKRGLLGAAAVIFLLISAVSYLKIQKLTDEKQQLQELTGHYGQKQSELTETGNSETEGGDGSSPKQPEDSGMEEDGEAEEDNLYEETDSWNNPDGPRDKMEYLTEETEALHAYLLRNTAKDNQEIIEQGEILKRELFRYLAAAYDREDRKEEALEAYQALCETEIQDELLESAYLRRITLEAEQHPESALQTGKEALERLPDSLPVAEKYLEILVKEEAAEEEIREILNRLSARFPDLETTENYQELSRRCHLTEGETDHEEQIEAAKY